MLIDGHVSSWTTDGVFFNLDKVKAGAEIQVERGDGIIYTYTISKVQVYSSNAITGSNLLLPINSTRPGLNLITCTGDIIKGTNEFNERVVIYSQMNSTN
jgi:LPXTG-site transpeptidase (sortase) family protein